VRESVTNVIRHSRAQHCLILLTQKNGTVRGEVLNDGGQRERVESTTRRGLGLAGLQERVSALGGHMEAGPCTLSGKASFRVCVELPMKPEGETQNVQEDDV
jgi:two-component system, NarL family, sensor histidine kinase DesK